MESCHRRSCRSHCHRHVLWYYKKKEDIKIGVGNFKSCLKGSIDYIDGYSKRLLQKLFQTIFKNQLTSFKNKSKAGIYTF